MLASRSRYDEAAAAYAAAHDLYAKAHDGFGEIDTRNGQAWLALDQRAT